MGKPKRKMTLEQRFIEYHTQKNSTLSFVVYGGIRRVQAKKIKTRKFSLLLGDTVTSKLDIMLIFNSDDKDALKSHVKVRAKTRAEGLTAIQRVKDRPVVLTSEIRDEISAQKPADVEVLFRTGHVVRGKVLGMSKYHLMLLVNDKQVIAYIHGIHQIHVHGKSTE